MNPRSEKGRMGFHNQLEKQPNNKYKKGLWSPDEDQKLTRYVQSYGHGCWSSVPVNAGLRRSGKSCRLRWINYLRPGLKRGAFSFEEEEILLTLHRILGNKWSQIAHHLPGRTDNEIKNYWHSHLKKRVSKSIEIEAKCKNKCINGEAEGPGTPHMAPGDSSIEKSDNMEASITETDESVITQITQTSTIQKCNLPRVLFAEWLSLDQFHDSNLSSRRTSDLRYSLEDNNSNSEYSVHNLPFGENAFASEAYLESNNSISTEDMLQSSFEFANQVTGSDLFHYFPYEYSANCADMYI